MSQSAKPVSQTLKIAVPQLAPIWMNREKTLDKVIDTIETAAKEGAELIAFGEGFVPGYPFWLDQTGGANFDSPIQKDLFAHYADQAVVPERGDLDGVCAALKAASMACYLGVIERAENRGGHSLYCSIIYIDATGTIGSTHRKLMPTYEERLVWSPGDGNGLRTHSLGAFTVGGLNCWENWMPLVRASLYAQGEDLHVANWPGSDRNTDISPFLAKEGRSFCLSISSLMRRSDVPDDMPHAKLVRDTLSNDMPANGGSCLAAPDGSWVLEPLTGEENLRYAVIDHKAVRQERQNFDPVGHYSRPDVTQLHVNRERQTTAVFKD